MVALVRPKLVIQVVPLTEVSDTAYSALHEMVLQPWEEGNSSLAYKLDEPEEDDIALLARHQRRLVGWACLNPMEGYDSARLNIYVLPRYRRKGIGRVLFEKATRVAKRRGYSSLYAQAANGASGDFWKALGFEEDLLEMPAGYDYYF